MRRAYRVLRTVLGGASAVALASAPVWAFTPSGQPSPVATPAKQATYDVLYQARLIPTERVARVSIRVERNPGLLLRLRIRIDPQRHFRFSGDGKIEVHDDHVSWSPPTGSGELDYTVRLDHLHDSVGYDARATDKWSLFRGEDLFPPMAVTTAEGARSRALLRLRLPVGWSVVTPFAQHDDGSYPIEQSHRRFDRPTGWILAGKLDVTRETVAGTAVTIAGPEGQGLRRLDLLALLRWTLPVLSQAAGKLPPRILIVGAGDPMWRGGLSGPGSLYIHRDRPLIESDGTSPLLHEIVHVISHARSAGDGDWVMEGLAEYYALELLVRSGTLSEQRHAKALDKLVAKGAKAETLRVARADAAVTARAVGVLRRLDAVLRELTGGQRSLDDVLRALDAERFDVTTDKFRELAERVAGHDLGDFFRKNVT